MFGMFLEKNGVRLHDQQLLELGKIVQFIYRVATCIFQCMFSLGRKNCHTREH